MPTATFQLQVWGEEVPNRRKAALLFKIYIYIVRLFGLFKGRLTPYLHLELSGKGGSKLNCSTEQASRTSRTFTGSSKGREFSGSCNTHEKRRLNNVHCREIKCLWTGQQPGAPEEWWADGYIVIAVKNTMGNLLC